MPFELRRLAAFRAEVLTALGRIFVEEIFASHRRRAPVANGESGAITFVQRFGGSLNLNVHFHVLVLDGVLTRKEEGMAFNEVPAPTREDVLAIAERTKTRALAWLKRKAHLVRREDESNEEPTLTALEACAQLAMQRGEFADVRAESDVAPLERPSYATAVETHGFNVHAGVRIARDDDLGREKLCRYGARPPFAMDRIRRLSDGRIAYQTKAASGRRARSRVMTPVEFLARLAALVPPPRYPLVRFHGVLAPKSSWRKEVVPKPPMTSARERSRAERCDERDKPIASSFPDRPRPPKSASERTATSSLAGASALFLSPNVLSVKHWNRLEEGLLLATTPRVAWPMLLRRCFSVDVLECASCGGRLRVMAVVTAEVTVSKILDHLKVRSVAPPTARARAPDDVGEQVELGW